MARIALVTGAAKNIGREVARQLAASGMTVVIGARTGEAAAAAAEALRADGLDVHAVQLDVDDVASIEDARQFIADRFGRLDILVNNAAAFADWTEQASAADLIKARALIDTNLFGAWRVTQAMLPMLRQSTAGRIVNVSSGAGSHADSMFGMATNAGSTSYAISKAALNALTVKFANELQNTAIKVNAVCPGLTATAPGMAEMGARPIPAGAASVVWAALIPEDGPSGGFFRDGVALGW
jgi:NAD(P)-dependent dehydrogenase (short-subunit alcohol dehydrogenase family)